MQQLKNQFQPTKDDLLIILNQSNNNLSIQKKISLLEQLADMYHQKRDFNLYEETIYIFYNKTHLRFHLGKTSIGVAELFKRTTKIVDILCKKEEASNDEIPAEHAKFLFAIIKEFVYAIEKLVKKSEFDGDYRQLAEQLGKQLASIKTILKMGKNNADIATVLDNVIRSIQKTNPMLLESPKGSTDLVVKEKNKKLTTGLSKMSKKTFIGLLEDLYSYEENDFFKIVQYAYNKYDNSIFREAKLTLIPLYLTIMARPSEKMEHSFFEPASFLSSYKREDLNSNSFYPMDFSDVDGFYPFFLSYLDKLEKEETIGEVEKEYLHFKFLKSTHQLSDNLANEFISFAEKYIDKVMQKISHADSKRLSSLLQSPYLYTKSDELILLDSDNSYRGDKASIHLSIKKGKVVCNWKGLTKKVPDPNRSFFDKVVPREDFILTEFHVIEDIQYSLLSVVKKYKNQPNFHVSDKMNHYLDLLDEQISNVEIDVMDEGIIKNIGWGFGKSDKLYARILVNRFEKDLLTDNELSLLFSSDFANKETSYEIIDSHVMIRYLKKAIEKNIINPSDIKGISQLFIIKINDNKLKDSFLYDILSKHYPEAAGYISTLVEQDIKNEETPFEVRRNNLVVTYFKQKLHSSGIDTNNFIV